MKKKIQIGGGGAPVGAGTAFDQRVIDLKCVSVYHHVYPNIWGVGYVVTGV
jgi:hypothetical protein